MDDQSAALAFLAAGAGLVPPGTDVPRIETHISFVFLIGERAFKLKRAVRYSYLDFSTLALREAACRAELEVNRRMAPTLYLGVRAIRRRADGTLYLGDGGAGAAPHPGPPPHGGRVDEVVDWVVEMRRFDAAGLFDRMAAEGRLTAPLMRDLADRIAAVHGICPIVLDMGGAAAMARVLDDNRDNLRLFAALDKDAVARLAFASRAALAQVAALLDRRRGEGHVRRCHGDLHLGNICRWDGQPTLFDAIEFSPALATIDVLYDLAFLLMDLVHRRLEGFAALVMNRYLDRAAEDDGLSALPLFLSARAAIRAHVSAAAKREEDAKAYLDLAAALLAPAPARLVAVGGLSGSGKSTLALALAPHLGAAPGARVLRTDVLRKTLAGVPPESPLPQSAYSKEMSEKVYARLLTNAARILGMGWSVIVDAVFLDPAERQAAARVAAEAGVPFTGLWLEAGQEVMAERIGVRRGDASDATAQVLAWQAAQDAGQILWTRIDAGGAPDATLAAARKAIGQA
jgi:uncharacterized protein